MRRRAPSSQSKWWGSHDRWWSRKESWLRWLLVGETRTRYVLSRCSSLWLPPSALPSSSSSSPFSSSSSSSRTGYLFSGCSSHLLLFVFHVFIHLSLLSPSPFRRSPRQSWNTVLEVFFLFLVLSWDLYRCWVTVWQGVGGCFWQTPLSRKMRSWQIGSTKCSSSQAMWANGQV